jgi:hypothetical protein
VLEIKRRNPRFGCPRIAQQIAFTFGVEINKDVVRRILAQYYRSEPGKRGPSWLSVIGKAKDQPWSLDLFRSESILLKSYWVMVVMDLFSRRIVGFAVEPADTDGICVCRMLNQVIAGQPLPKYLSSDNDPLFRFHNGRQLCASSRSRRSRPCRSCHARTRLSNGSLGPFGASTSTGFYSGIGVTSSETRLVRGLLQRSSSARIAWWYTTGGGSRWTITTASATRLLLVDIVLSGAVSVPSGGVTCEFARHTLILAGYVTFTSRSTHGCPHCSGTGWPLPGGV